METTAMNTNLPTVPERCDVQESLETQVRNIRVRDNLARWAAADEFIKKLPAMLAHGTAIWDIHCDDVESSICGIPTRLSGPAKLVLDYCKRERLSTRTNCDGDLLIDIDGPGMLERFLCAQRKI